MSRSLETSVVAAWVASDRLKTASGPWLTFAKPKTSYPYAVFDVRAGKTLPSFGGHREDQYNVELNVYTDDDVAAQDFLDAMDVVFNETKFAMTAPEQCMVSRRERPGEVRQAGVRDNKAVYRARCVYLVRVFVPAST